jgi:DNA-binding transcriptional MocR family regulator
VTHTSSIQGGPIEATWSRTFAAGKGSRYLRILGLVENSIAEGRLRIGDRLPPQRRVAKLLGVDLTTVTRAYAEAKARGLVESRGPVGTFVASPSVDFTPMADLSMNMPPSPGQSDLRALLKQGLSHVMARTDADLLMTYHSSGGSRADRAAGSRWLGAMFGRVDPARVVVCPGAQAALAALILVLTRPGEAILAEPLVYPGLLAAAETLDRRIVVVARDEHGMRPDALEQACRAHSATLVYLNPTVQNPTTHTMPAKRRRALAQVAVARGLRLIEDDPYWPFDEQAPEPVACAAPARTYYVSTLSKCLTPGLRTAYVLLPDEMSQPRFLEALRSFALMASPLPTALATQWVHDGSAAQLLERVRAEAWVRYDLAAEILGAPARTSARGIHFWHTLPPHWTSQAFARAARAEGLAVTSSEAFCAAAADPPNAIRLSLGGIRERSRLADALRQMNGLLARKTAAARAIVI